MKILYCSNNEKFIGNLFTTFLKENNVETFSFNIDNQNIDHIEEEIIKNKITNIVCNFGKSYGKNIFSTSFIEQKIEENIKYNLYLPLLLCNLSNRLNVHFTFFGNGCLFIDKFNNSPLNSSSHSIVTGYNDRIMNSIYDNILYLRFRYPVSGDMDPRCYLSKLGTYKNILNSNNSISILNDMFPIILSMLKQNTIGNYNMVNKGYINSFDLILKYKYLFNSNVNFNEISLEEHNKLIGERSNCVIDTHQLEEYCANNNIILKDVNTSIDNILLNLVSNCSEIKHCLCCLSETSNILDLGIQPLANDFNEYGEINKIYPLNLKYCKKCFHCQLSHSVNPEILFKNYKYVSGTSNTGLKFFKENAKFIHELVSSENKNKRVLDIACNDGSQLNYFRELGWDTYGVDPAENLCPIAEKQGHKIICDFWNETSAKKLPIMDVITAQNVFAHTRYLDEFLESCKLIMNEHSHLFIQTSQKDMIMNGEFDTTYHEHISFYNTRSMDILTKRNGLVLNRIHEHSIHGKSYIFEIKLSKNSLNYNINEHLLIEENLGLYNSITYDKFRLNAERTIINLKLLIEKYSMQNYKIIGFGAAAKGQTVLCYGNIDLEYIIDENPLKIGQYSPKLNIPIVSIDHFKNDYTNSNTNFLIIILAWNFASEIKQKIYDTTNSNKNNTTNKIVVVEKYFPQIVLN